MYWIYLKTHSQFLATENPLKMKKNAFYFTLKTFSVLEIFKFLFWVFSHVGKRLDTKAKENFKIYVVTNWETNNCNNILPDIWRSTGNQTMKFDQFIKYNMRNIFLGKSYTKCRAKIKVPTFSISLDQVLNFTQFDFMVCLTRSIPKSIEIRALTKDCLCFL